MEWACQVESTELRGFLVRLLGNRRFSADVIRSSAPISHSEFSRLDGLGTAVQYAQRAADLGQFALAQTDHGTLSGALHHIQACTGKDSKGKKLHEPLLPISGVEAYFRPNRITARDKKQRNAWHLCLYAKNLRGWHNLLRIVSVAYADPADGGGFYQYPCVDPNLLRQYSEGIACSSACVSSWLNELIKGGDSVAVRDYIFQMQSIFGADFWLEIMPHDFDDQRTLNIETVRLAQEFSVPLLATNDAHFPYAEWAETHRLAKMMSANKSFADLKDEKKNDKVDYLREVNPTLYLSSESEMYEWFGRNHPDLRYSVVDESIRNTGLFAQGMSPFLLGKTNKLPKVTESPAESERIIKKWIEEGFDRIVAQWYADGLEDEDIEGKEEVYRKRVETEFKVLKDKGVLDYFVMVGEVCRWAKEQGIRVGLGRGSAAGCLVSYLVSITAIDPISYGLLFERFLNPERKGLPDIDLDFQSDRRHEVKEFIQTRYGEDHVADIITHSRFQPKSVLQDLCRVYNVPYMEAHAVTDTIDIRADDEETTLEELLPTNEKLQEFKSKHPEIWTHAIRFEGGVKNAGKHAAGIIITPEPVAKFMALERGKKGDLVTSWSDSADFPVVSDYGFVKLDALGIKGLQKHGYACDLIFERTGQRIDLNDLPALRDPFAVDLDVMEGFCNGYTIGIFQFGGRGITGLIRDIQPDHILDLAAANALYRPGPMHGGVTWDYAKRKHGGEFELWHTDIDPIIEETYGLIAYQEQVMQISQILGQFSAAEADDLRKAMGKLYRIKGGTEARDFMSRYEEKWFFGCSLRGVSKKMADEIWHKILQFGSYGFNRSHSASYALQAYQDMWLKIKYPMEFYASLLTLEDDEEKRKIAIREARSRNIKILPPDVNKSSAGWSVDEDGNALRFGLEAIKGVGYVGAQKIVEERKTQGDFSSYEEFVERVPSRSVNAAAICALTEAGSLDEFGLRDEWSQVDVAVAEKSRLGMVLSVPDSTSEHADLIRENIYTQEEVAQASDGTTVIIGGEIAKVEIKKTKKGDPFANVNIVFEMNEWRVKFWQRELARYKHLLVEGKAIMVSGKKDEWNGWISVVANEVTDVETFAGE